MKSTFLVVISRVMQRYIHVKVSQGEKLRLPPLSGGGRAAVGKCFIFQNVFLWCTTFVIIPLNVLKKKNHKDPVFWGGLGALTATVADKYDFFTTSPRFTSKYKI